MSIEAHVEEFAGLRVRDYVPFKGIADPHGTAYRLTTDYDRDELGLPTFDELFEQLLAEENVAELAGLVIGQWDPEDCSVGADALVERIAAERGRLRNLAALFVGDIVRREQEISWIVQTDYSPIWSAYPELYHLRIRGGSGLSLGTVRHEGLRSLVLESGGLPATVVRDVADAVLPSLEHLELWFGEEHYGGDAALADIEPLLDPGRFPELRILGLRNCRFADEVARAVAESELLGRLDELDLSFGTLGDDGFRALLDSPHTRQLSRLDVHHHFASPELVDRLCDLPLEVDASERLEPDADWGGRYISVSE